LAAPNLDPRRIAFMVVERARIDAPADFAEDETDSQDQVHLNVHVLRTMILRSLEHLQRVALIEWTERNLEDRQHQRATEVASRVESVPISSDERPVERLQTLGSVTNQPVSLLEAEASITGSAVSGSDPVPLSAVEHLEEDLKEVLDILLIGRSPASATPSSLPETAETHETGTPPERPLAVLPSEAEGHPLATEVDLENDIKNVLSAELSGREPS
jgi:hypothetical protein